MRDGRKVRDITNTIIFIILVLVTGIFCACLLANGSILIIQKSRKKDACKKNIDVIKKVGMILPVSITVTLLFILYTQLSAETPMIPNETNSILKNSIATLEKIELNGRKEWISIRGQDKDNPIILFLAGGPGGTQMAAVRKNLAALEKDYVVVNWDQPGSGKSYNALSLDEISVNTYIEDGIALTEYLCQRFNKEKIFLIGESWGSALAVFMAAEKSQYYSAIIGTGQMVAFKETEILDYNKALEIAEERNDTGKILKLKANGPPPYYGKDVVWKSAEYLNYLSSYMVSNKEIYNSGFDTIGDIMSEEYGIIDKINFVRGVINTYGKVYQTLYEIDLRENFKTLDVPIYFFIGSHDINAPTVLVEDYYEKLNAPKKDLVWFTHSGHNPWINEREKFVEEVKKSFK